MMLKPSTVLATLYFAYFAVFGVFVPFSARFLTAQGWLPSQISSLFVAVMLAQLIGPLLLSSISDRFGRRLRIVRWATASMWLALALAYALLAMPLWVYGCGFIFGLALSITLPQLEALCLQQLGTDQSRYGRVRLWGSLGFACMTLTLGVLMEWLGLWVYAAFISLFLALLWLASWALPDAKAVTGTQAVQHSLRRAWPKGLSVLLLVALLWQMSFAPYNTFYDQYLSQQGYAAWQIGAAITLGVLAEIVLFAFSARLMRSLGSSTALMWALLFTALRWSLLLAFVPWPGLQIAWQSLHAFSFALAHLAFVQLLAQQLGPNFRASAQALYQAASTGMGLMLGNLWLGPVYQASGGLELPMQLAAASAFAALLLLLFWRWRYQRPGLLQSS